MEVDRCPGCGRSVEPVYRAGGGRACPVCAAELGKIVLRKDRLPARVSSAVAWTSSHARWYRAARLAQGVAWVSCLLGVVDIAVRSETSGQGWLLGGRHTFAGFLLTSLGCLIVGLIARKRLRQANQNYLAIQAGKAVIAGSIGVALGILALLLAPSMIAGGSPERQLILDEQTQLIPSNQSALFRFAMARPAVIHFETKFMRYGNGEGGLYMCTVPADDLGQYLAGNATSSYGCRLQEGWLERDDVELPAGSYAFVVSCEMETPCSLTIKVEGTIQAD